MLVEENHLGLEPLAPLLEHFVLLTLLLNLVEYVRYCCVEGRMRGWELKRRRVEGRVKKRGAYELGFMKSLSEELSVSEAEKIP